MISFALSELAEKLDGHLFGADLSFSAISTDTRSLKKGDFYVALSGPNFDGHDFIQQAEDAGAAAAMTSRQLDVDMSQLVVADTRLGLGRLAAEWRQKTTAPVVAITGSNGKTTLKEMLASILSTQGSVLATRGNLNNDIGVPLTLTRLQGQDYAVIELGANHLGEIAYLSAITAPDIAVLNNAGRAHLEGFGDLEAVAHAKAEIIDGLSEDGIFVFNADDAFADLWRKKSSGRQQLTFGLGDQADIRSPEQEADLVWTEEGFTSRFSIQTPSGHFDVGLQLAGEHNRMNALAAAAAGYALNVDLQEIKSGLEQVQPQSGRLSPSMGIHGVRLIDDSYNANPDSVAAAISVLASAPGKRILVLGDMAELGQAGEQLYRQIGDEARAAGIESLLTCGASSRFASESFGDGAGHYAEQSSLINALKALSTADTTVLVKGSRTAGMDAVVTSLMTGVKKC